MYIIQSAGIFVPDLKTDPYINFSRWQEEVFQESMNTENIILGPYGLLFVFLTDAEWQALPLNLLEAAIPAIPAIGGAAAVPAVPAVYRGRYDYTTPPPKPPNNAANAVLKDFELQTNNKAAVYKAYIHLRAKLINSLPQEDIGALSQPPFGVGNRSALDLYTRAVTQYSQLTSDDFSAISTRLKASKTSTQSYAALANAHRDMHNILLTAGQPLAEKDNCAYFIEALNTDAAGMYGAQLYTQTFPLIHTRTFNGLVEHVILHARNSIITTGSMHYASAASVLATPPAIAGTPAPAFGAADLAALSAENAQLKKELKALRKTAGPVGRPKFYCWVHGTCFHPGKKCTVMLADSAKYTTAHLNSVSSSSPPNGKP